MRFPPSFLDEIRDRVTISSVLGQRVTWDRKKTNRQRGDYWACCPFHGEKTPSFHCEDGKGRYHCFGCGASGDHFRFLTELEGLSFPEAVERIAGMAGVPMPELDEEEEKREKQRATLHEVMELAAQFFQDQLHSPVGARARSYLRDRGLTPATQQSFGLGFAPDSRNALKEHLAAKGVEKEQMEACGLTYFGPDVPVSYDRFRDRIMFPILDASERVIAFGGRAMSSDVSAKYLNSPETELFHKGNVLYNYSRARTAARKAGVVIAVEGYMDVIALAQAGFDNVVAPLGTALTESQLGLLWRMADEPVLCFDGDQAGLKAAWRAADLALPAIEPGRSVRFAMLPEGQDPDDIVRKDGPEAFRAALDEASPLAEILWRRETAGVFDTPERRAELERTLRELSSRIRNESVRFHYAQEMRDRVHSYFGARRPRRSGSEREKGPTGAGQWSRGGGAMSGRLAVSESLMRSSLVKTAGGVLPLRETILVVSLVNHPDLIEMYFDEVEAMDFQHPDLQKIHAAIIDVLAHEAAPRREAIIEKMEQEGLAECWQRCVDLARKARQWPALEDAAVEDARDAFCQALHLHRSARSLHKELKAAEAALATDPTEENYRHLIEIQAQFRDVQATEAIIEGFGVSSGRAGRNF